MPNDWVILVLIALIVFQQFYWQRIVQKLIDKLMSRNYGDYVQSKATAERVTYDGRSQSVQLEEAIDDLGGLNGLNVG